jgi:hypothetical protein
MVSKLRESIKALKYIVRNPFAFPGGYENFLGTSDGECICAGCCQKRYRTILKDQRVYRDRVQDVAACSANFDGPIVCALCDGVIVEGGEA